VLILSDGQDHGSSVASAQVLNGDVLQASYHRPYQRWRNDNQRALAANPDNLSAAQTARPADYANRVWQFHRGGLLDNSCPAGQGGSNNGWTDKDNRVIYINAHCDDGSVLVHEFFHALEGRDQKQEDFGNSFDEGIVDFFARDVSKAYNYAYKGNIAYNGGYLAAKDIVDRLGLPFLCRLWFVRPADWLHDLGPIAIQDISRQRPFIMNEEDARKPLRGARDINQFCTLGQAKLQAAVQAGQLPPFPPAAQPAAQLPVVPAVVQPPAQLPVVPASAQPAKKWADVPALNKPFRSRG